MSVVLAAITTFSPKFSDVLSPDHSSSPFSPSCGDSASLSSHQSHDPPQQTKSNGPYEMRRNEHLAVLLPKSLWKPDSRSIHCDNFFCRAKFSLFERRHHCRKCGGVFCHFCSSKTTPLLDTSNLTFLHPPRDVPLTAFETTISPIIDSRVCDDCWEQIHGVSTPRTPDLVHSSPGLVRCQSLRSDSSCSSLSTPPHDLPPMPRRYKPDTPRMPSEPSLGGLDAYPLRRSSAICKATGGGRWEPKQIQQHPGHRLPGGKAPFEIEMEREEEEERLRRLNPIVRDGEFQYRFPREPEPPAATNWDYLSTF